MIDDLLTALAQAGIEPDADELRDALWLADHVAVEPAWPTPSDNAAAATAELAVAEAQAVPVADDTPRQAVAGEELGEMLAAGRSVGAPGSPVRGVAVQRPRARRTGGQAEMARALRPFGRRVPARSRLVLDEDATVSRIADEGLWSPVLRPDTERWLSLTIAVDPAPTMALWRRQISQFQGFAEQLGLFRLVRAQDLEAVDGGSPHRQAVLLMTDGISDDWRDGTMRELLRRWGTRQPVAVCNLLPPQMWPGTGLDVVAGRARSWKPGAPNKEWIVDAGTPGAAVPVVRLSAPWLGSWARMVVGTSGWTPVALLAPATPAPDDQELSARGLVERFRLGASPQAFRLACLLAAAWLTLPVMQFVRDLMLPEADDGHLAQFFLGGLLTRGTRLAVPPERARFDFRPGVREHLVDHLRRDDLVRVVRESSSFLAAQHRQPLDVTAMIGDPENALRGQENIEPGSPLHVAAAVLARLGGRYRALLAALPSEQPAIPAPPPAAAAVPAGGVPAVNTGQSPGPSRPGLAERLLSGRYELGEPLGNGSMSEVHMGRDVRLGRDVAVKVLRADLAGDPQFRERFRREAQNSASLNHPAIVAVYDTGETPTGQGTLPFIVMEYVDGRNLQDILRVEGPVPGQRAMEIMADVCAALDFTHRQGIVHRDVKPANVMVTKSGAVKVMDFGIARALYGSQPAVTRTSAVIGTAQYLSPEQARGEAVDARSDVYGMGCVLFELVTGKPVFTGNSPVAVAHKHVREDPRKPSQLNPRVSPQLDAIVLKALAKPPAERYQSAAEMRMDLVRALSGQRTVAQMSQDDQQRRAMPVKPEQRRRGWFRK